VRIGGIGIQAYCLTELGNGAVEIALHQQTSAAIGMGRGVVRL
jgi:hypothetical protein